MRGSIQRVQVERAIASLDRFVEAPSLRENIAQSFMQLVAVLIVRYGLTKAGFSAADRSPSSTAALARSRRPDAASRVTSGGAARALGGFVELAGRLEELTEQAMPLGQLRRQRDGAAAGRHRFAILAGCGQHDCEIVVRGREVVFQGDRQPQAADGLGEMATPQQRPAEHMMRSGVPRVEIGRPAQGGNRGSEFPCLEEPHPELPMPLGIDHPPLRQGRSARRAGSVGFGEEGGGQAGSGLAEPLGGLANLGRFGQGTDISACCPASAA